MAGRLRHEEYALHIHPALLHNARHFARLRGETLKKWLTEAIIAKLEDEIDEAAALEAMADDDDAISVEDYIETRRKRDKRPDEK